MLREGVWKDVLHLSRTLQYIPTAPGLQGKAHWSEENGWTEDAVNMLMLKHETDS